MFRIPAQGGIRQRSPWTRPNSSSSFIRNTFINYFKEKHGHKFVKSSSVVPLCDPSVPFVNAGMNQFKGVFLGKIEPPCQRAVNSQKCVRVGGKHNDLGVVGTDGYHHTFFEMLGNWSFGDYYKAEACKMAWELLLGPYKLKPENLLVTYFSGDVIIDLQEDRECRDIWTKIGVPKSRLKALGAADNFWEMGASGPCGPCTEIHYVQPDGTLIEIWNLVFIQCNRDADGKVRALRKQHVDTGMGLERMAAILQNVPSNYETDLFKPLIKTIEKNSKGTPEYRGQYGPPALVDSSYRRLADHARMVSVAIADGAYPSVNVNLKQILRSTIKLSEQFNNPSLLPILYDQVTSILGETYPELITQEKEVKLIIEHEREAYGKLRSGLNKKWKELTRKYPEVELMGDVENPGFSLGYTELKEAMAKQKTNVIPGELVFKLYDTHGLQEDLIQQVAKINNWNLDKEGFQRYLTKHKSRHKIALKEQTSNIGMMFDKAIGRLLKENMSCTNDQPKYDLNVIGESISFPILKTNLVAILNEDGEWIDCLELCENRPYYLVTKDTNFYCQEGGQTADSGVIHIKKDTLFNVESVFKIRDFVFHKGTFNSSGSYIKCNSDVMLEINSDERIKVMRNHTAVHLLNAAVRKVLKNSVVCQIGSNVTDRGLSLSLSVYGEKINDNVISHVQELVRNAIKSNDPIEYKILDHVQLSKEGSVLTVPGEIYPEVGLRLVHTSALTSKELCCGTHVPSTGFIDEFCITNVKGAGGHSPTIHALTGDAAREAQELFCRVEKLEEVIRLLDPVRCREETSKIRERLSQICTGSGAPSGDLARCLRRLEALGKKVGSRDDIELLALARTELRDAVSEAHTLGRPFVVHFLRCSYLMQGDALSNALRAERPANRPSLILGCAGGVIAAACSVPQDFITDKFNAPRWLACILPIFNAQILKPSHDEPPHLYAEMSQTKVSLIHCEQMVQDAMRVAIKYAQAHGATRAPSQDRRQN